MPSTREPGLSTASRCTSVCYVYSCRKIEERLLRDVHFIWLAGYEKPDFATINRFRNRVKKEINAVFTQVVLLLAERGFVSLDVEYIDGTKIESKANRYTFVWRKTMEKNRTKLLEKIKVLLAQIDDVIAQDNASEQEKVEFTPELLSSMASELNAALAAGPKGATKAEKQKHKERKNQAKELQEKAEKLAEYDKHLETTGERWLILQDRPRCHLHAPEGGRYEQRSDQACL